MNNIIRLSFKVYVVVYMYKYIAQLQSDKVHVKHIPCR